LDVAELGLLNIAFNNLLNQHCQLDYQCRRQSSHSVLGYRGVTKDDSLTQALARADYPRYPLCGVAGSIKYLLNQRRHSRFVFGPELAVAFVHV